MSAGKLTWGQRDWLGLMVLFLSSIAADVIGALLAVKGILPMGSVAAWVYGGWSIGTFSGLFPDEKFWLDAAGVHGGWLCAGSCGASYQSGQQGLCIQNDTYEKTWKISPG